MPSKVRRTEAAVEEPRVLEAPSHDDIAARAYAAYQRRGERHGQDLDDWLRAERELLVEQTGQLTTPARHDDADDQPAPRPLGFVEA